MKHFTSQAQKTGELGEQLAVKFLVKHGFTILDRNATFKGGEIDIIAEKTGKLHFVEVKASSVHVSRETTYNPFQNVSRQKIRKMEQSVLVWLGMKGVSPARAGRREAPWQLDAIAVYLNRETRKAQISYLQNINII
jgi:putative endonuclease